MSACHEDNSIESKKDQAITTVKIRESITIPWQGIRGFIGFLERGTTGAFDNVWIPSDHHAPSRVLIMSRALFHLHIRCDLWTKAEANLKMLSKEGKSCASSEAQKPDTIITKIAIVAPSSNIRISDGAIAIP